MGKNSGLELAIYDISPIEDGHTSENSANTKFSRNVLRILGKEEAKSYPIDIKRFNDGNIEPIIENSVRGKKVFVFQSYVGTVGDRKYDMELTLDAIKWGGCNKEGIVVVWPHCFGSRGDRRDGSRKALHSLDFAKSIQNAETLLTGGIHSDGVLGMYNQEGVYVECLRFEPVVANYVLRTFGNCGKVLIAGPDAGSLKRVQRVEKIINDVKEWEGVNLDVVIDSADKIRIDPHSTKVKRGVSRVEGLDVIIVDDIGDTLGTLYGAGKSCREGGAKSVRALLYHGTLGRGYESNLDRLFAENVFDEIIFGNTVPIKKCAKDHPKVKILPFEPLFASAVKRIYDDRSMSEVFRYESAMEIYDRSRYLFKGDPKYVKIGHIKLPTLDS